MANSRITGLTQLAAQPATNDLFEIVDVSDTTMAAIGTNKKLTRAYVVTTTGDAASVTGGGTIVLGGNDLTVGKSCSVAGEDTTNGFLAAQTFHAPVIMDRDAITIASGAITPTSSYVLLDTEGAAATDDLATITAGTTGQLLFLQTASSSRDVTVKHGTGNIYLSGGADFTLDNLRCSLLLIAVGSEWREVSHSHNHA